MTEQRFSVEVAAPAERVWAAATDWEQQGRWMFATRVRDLGDSRLRAVTGLFGRIGVPDNMEIVEWDPPRHCRVLHKGPVLLGDADFTVVPTENGARFDWSERITLPGGAVGRALFAAGAPGFGYFVRLSLRRFAEWAKDYPA